MKRQEYEDEIKYRREQFAKAQAAKDQSGRIYWGRSEMQFVARYSKEIED